MAADFDSIEWIPQAILRVPVDYFTKKCGLFFFKREDELDEYEGANLQLPDGRPYALRHYKGYPAGTVTIYLPFEVTDVVEISSWVRAITDTWNLPPTVVQWERQDGLPGQR
jgi:hypothetical protein